MGEELCMLGKGGVSAVGGVLLLVTVFFSMLLRTRLGALSVGLPRKRPHCLASTNKGRAALGLVDGRP